MRKTILKCVLHCIVAILLYLQAVKVGYQHGWESGKSENDQYWGTTVEKYTVVLGMYLQDGWERVNLPAPNDDYPRAGMWGWQRNRYGELRWTPYGKLPDPKKTPSSNIVAKN